MEPIASGLIYAGAFLMLAALRLGRRVGLAGAAILIVGLLLPPQGIRTPVAETLLDQFAPAYQFQQRHEIEIETTPDRVYSAILNSTANEIALFRALIWIWRLGGQGPESSIDSPGSKPLLEVAMQTTYTRLAEDPGREIVLGLAMGSPNRLTPRQFIRGNWFEATLEVMSFRVVSIAPERSRVITETRVYATAKRDRFALYWRLIYPVSSLIRYPWLHAIRARALREGPRPPSAPPVLAGCFSEALTAGSRVTLNAILLRHYHGLALRPPGPYPAHCWLDLPFAPAAILPPGESSVTLTGVLRHADGFRRELKNGFGYHGASEWAIEVDEFKIR